LRGGRGHGSWRLRRRDGVAAGLAGYDPGHAQPKSSSITTTSIEPGPSGVRATTPTGTSQPTTRHGVAHEETRAGPAAGAPGWWEITAMPDAHTMNYIECDAPVELTLVEWRRSHTQPKRSRWQSFRAAFAA
jgi:hypothetical protein